LDQSYVLGFNLAIIVLIIELFIYDPVTDRVKYGYHVRFDEGFNDLPLAQLPPNVVLMDRREERVPAETLTITIPPFTTSKHPFFHEDDVTVKAVCESDMCGFELSKDDCMKCVYISGLKKDGKGTKGRQSCNLGCIFLFHVPSRGGAKRRGKIQCSGNSSFPFPFFSVPFGSAKRNTEFDKNRRKRKS